MAIESVGLINPVLQFEDATGVPYAGGSIAFYIVGTSTPQNVYSDSALTVSLGNVVTLNAAGRSSTSSTGPDTPVYLQQKTYDFSLFDVNSVKIYGPITVSGSQWPGQVQGQAILSPAANANGYTNRFTTTLNKAGSGTHAIFAGTRFDIPTIGSGASTLTEADTVYIEGAPATGTNKYALKIAAGDAYFNGNLTVTGTFTGGAGLTNHAVVVGASTGFATIPVGITGQVLGGVTGADPAFVGMGVQDRQVTLQTVVNTTTDTAVYTYAVPANLLGTNKTLRLSLIGDHIINNGSADSCRVHVLYGATNLFDATVPTVNNGANRGSLSLDMELTAMNATNVQTAKGFFQIGDSSQNNANGTASSLASTNSYTMYAAGVPVAEDSTVIKNLVVKFQMGTANALIDMRAKTVYTELK